MVSSMLTVPIRTRLGIGQPRRYAVKFFSFAGQRDVSARLHRGQQRRHVLFGPRQVHFVQHRGVRVGSIAGGLHQKAEEFRFLVTVGLQRVDVTQQRRGVVPRGLHRNDAYVTFVSSGDCESVGSGEPRFAGTRKPGQHGEVSPLVGPQPRVQLDDEFRGKMPAFADNGLDVGKIGRGYM